MQTTRRGLLAMGALASLGWATSPRTALGAISVQSSSVENGKALISIFLRGGADGLSLVAPVGEEEYFRQRPTLALAAPRGSSAIPGSRTLDLNGFFGLHPALAPLLPYYRSGELAFVHACGSGDQTRSHFEAMATMERGLFQDERPTGGWLARHLATAKPTSNSPLRAVAFGSMIPETLRGANNATALESLDQVKLISPFTESSREIETTLARMYSDRNTQPALAEAGHESISVLDKLRGIDTRSYRPANGAHYPQDDFGRGLSLVACLLKSEVGLEAACLDHGSYDTHVAQGAGTGYLSTLLSSLSSGLDALIRDLGPTRWANTTVVVLSEFGRRLAENSGAGTDHGRGGVMMVLGGHGIAGGSVHGLWPGLTPDRLDGPGDLKVTTDYRNVLAEVLSHRFENNRIGDVFPGLTYQRVGVTV